MRGDVWRVPPTRPSGGRQGNGVRAGRKDQVPRLVVLCRMAHLQAETIASDPDRGSLAMFLLVPITTTAALHAFASVA